MNFFISIPVVAILYIALTLSYIITAVSNIVFPFTKRNYTHNRKLIFRGYIHSQKSGNAAMLRIGYFKAPHNGCGAIATYNACRMIGKTVAPADIIRYFESGGALLLLGALGINPLSVHLFFRERAVKSKLLCLPKSFDKKIEGSRAAILIYLHRKGAHFVAVMYSDSSFNIFNDSNRAGPLQVKSIDKWLAEKGYRPLGLIVLA